jgi:hypothetical protein
MTLPARHGSVAQPPQGAQAEPRAAIQSRDRFIRDYRAVLQYAIAEDPKAGRPRIPRDPEQRLTVAVKPTPVQRVERKRVPHLDAQPLHISIARHRAAIRQRHARSGARLMADPPDAGRLALQKPQP